MTTYHLRRAEKAIDDPTALMEIIHGQKYLTLALCRENKPYLVTLNYAFDPEGNCFYFHCAAEGRKLDILRENPRVWGQILEDCGYQQGKCDHAFRTVQFSGTVTFLQGIEEKKRALTLMIEILEAAPEPVKTRTLKPKAIAGVIIGRITVEQMTGKQNLSA